MEQNDCYFHNVILVDKKVIMADRKKILQFISQVFKNSGFRKAWAWQLNMQIKFESCFFPWRTIWICFNGPFLVLILSFMKSFLTAISFMLSWNYLFPFPANCFAASNVTLHERFSRIQNRRDADFNQMKLNSDPEFHR